MLITFLSHALFLCVVVGYACIPANAIDRSRSDDSIHNPTSLRSVSTSSSASASSLSSDVERNLIIGGYQATEGRFPYYVALLDVYDNVQCGGTLIAPDIVLTAAHCEGSDIKYALVGRYTKLRDDGHERIEVANPYTDFNIGDVRSSVKAKLSYSGFLHPEFDHEERNYDIMLMKLTRPASNVPSQSLMRINMDPTVPVKIDGGKNEISVIGMGNLDHDKESPKADTLQQVFVDYLPYDQCVDSQIDSQNIQIDYKYHLFPQMICAKGSDAYERSGHCFGDSGGPYILLGNSPEEDVQVGVVSWSVSCSKTKFPMVGSRTSASVDFIRDVACTVSVDPPNHLCDGNVVVYGQSVQKRGVDNSVPVSVRIYSDPYGHEISWKITDQIDTVYADVPYGKIVGDHSFHTVNLPSGSDLRFVINDAADDGIFGNPDAILYELVLLDDVEDREIVIVQGDGQFTSSRVENFRVPIRSEYQAMFASRHDNEADTTTALDRVGSSGDPMVTLVIEIEFDDYHEDASWQVTSPDGSTVYASKGPNSYRYGSDAREEVDLRAGQYVFTIMDRRGTDDHRAIKSYNLYYEEGNNNDLYNSGNDDGKKTTIYDSLHHARFEGESESHAFEIVVSAAVQQQQHDDSQPSISIPGLLIEDESGGGNHAGAYHDNLVPVSSTNQARCAGCSHFCTIDSDCCVGNCWGNKCTGSECTKSKRTTIGSSDGNSRSSMRGSGSANGSDRGS